MDAANARSTDTRRSWAIWCEPLNLSDVRPYELLRPTIIPRLKSYAPERKNVVLSLPPDAVIASSKT